MGKRSSTAVGAAAAVKKVKIADAEGSAVGRWVQSKAGNKELSQAEKMSLLKNTSAESLAAGPEIPGSLHRFPAAGFVFSPASFPSRSSFRLRDLAP
jgi:hypothetical protein